MNEKLQIFENPEFGQVRVIVNNSNEPLFCLVDVCRILSIDNSRQVKSRLDEDGVFLLDLQQVNGAVINNDGVIINELGNTKANFINEANLYSVIFQSRKEEAKRFQKWVFNDVLPSIRKTGSYSVRTLSPAELIIAQGQAMLALEQKQREHEMRLSATENKVNELASIQEENLKQLNKLPLSEEEVIKITPRQELNQMVRTYAQSAGIEYNEVWNKIYSELYYRYHISINAYKKEKGENNLDIAEKIGVIDKLKVIVSSLIKEIGKVRPLVKK